MIDVSFFGGDEESGGVFVVQTKCSAGKKLGQHAHEHGHLSYLVSGTAIVDVDGKSEALIAPCSYVIEAGKVHEVTAVTDIVWLCLWDSKNGVIEKAKESMELLNED